MLAKAASLGGDVAGVLVGSGVAALAARGRRSYGAAKVYVADDAALEAPLPQPRVDVLAKVVARRRLRHRALRALGARRRRRRRPRRAARRGLNWDLVDLVREDGALVGKRPALARLRLRRRRLEGRRRDSRSFRSGTFEPAETRRRAPRSRRSPVELEDFSTGGDDGRAGARGGERARRSRTPT